MISNYLSYFNHLIQTFILLLPSYIYIPSQPLNKYPECYFVRRLYHRSLDHHKNNVKTVHMHFLHPKMNRNVEGFYAIFHA